MNLFSSIDAEEVRIGCKVFGQSVGQQEVYEDEQLSID